MSKLYVFAIGGTGARVLKSLSFLLASGVQCDVDKIIPIIIDPDDSNGDVSLTTDIMRKYRNIRNELTFDEQNSNRFFSTELDSLTDNFKIQIQNSNQKFKDYIQYGSLDRANKALTSLLFSQKNLESHMNVGFKGNPNMGSVVLNQFQTSQDFENFAADFSQGDRIFIISSIFGGTGAAGFPLLLKNLRQASPSLSNHTLLQNSMIGAISVLPYFGVKNDENSEIDDKSFISKTRAALHYYEHGVSNVNRMYYIGDNRHKNYENFEGSTDQKNDAHLIEMISALAVINFANYKIQNDQLPNEVLEFGMDNDSGNIVFGDLNEKTKNIIYHPMTQYYLSYLFWENELSDTLDQKYAVDLKINSDFLKSGFYSNLKDFNTFYWSWLNQMSKNDRGFSPFTLNKSGKNIFDAVKGIKLKNGSWLMAKNYERFTSFLNDSIKIVSNNEKTENKFINIFYNATQSIINR